MAVGGLAVAGAARNPGAAAPSGGQIHQAGGRPANTIWQAIS
jgi:hypothetical protein